MAATGRHPTVTAKSRGERVPGWVNQIYNMPQDKISDYETFHLYILDDVDRNAGVEYEGNVAQLRHAEFCNIMRDVFANTFANFDVHSIRMPNGRRSNHLLQLISAQMSNKTSKDLVVFCFEGLAGGDGNDYTL
jgi:hypothetical protein